MAHHKVQARGRRCAVAGGFTAAALGLAACGGGGGGEGVAAGPPEAVDQAGWDEVVSGAEEEGEVVFYSSLSDTEPVIEAFEEKYPEITVTLERAPTGDLVTRLDQELEVDAGGADVAMHSQSDWFEERDSQERFGSISVSPDQADNGWEERLDGKGYASVFTNAYVLGYNTKSAEKVNSMEDLPEAAKGKTVGVPDAAITPAQTYLYSLWRDAYGEDYLQNLEQDSQTTMYGSNVPLAQGLASGELDYGVGLAPSTIQDLKAEGAAVDIVVPEEANSGVPYTAATLANAQNPQAAQVFLDFLISEEGAELFTKHNGPASTPVEVEGSIPWGDLPTYAEEGWTEDEHLAFTDDEFEPVFK